MSKVKTEQRRLEHRGRHFHFVSYEGQAGNPSRLLPATEPSWFLMCAGKRWQALPHQDGQDPVELDRLLAVWLDEHVFLLSAP